MFLISLEAINNMRRRIIFLITLFFIFFAGVTFAYLYSEKQEMSLISSFTYFGKFDNIYLFDEGKFLMVDQISEEGIECYKGEISKEKYDYFKDYVQSHSVFELEIDQRRDPRLICEGGTSLEVELGNESNRLYTPCVEEYTEETESIKKVMLDIREELENLIEESKEPCKEGVFVRASGRMCSGHEENVSTFDPRLLESVSREGNYIYLGERSEKIDSYHRESYNLNGECYTLLLYLFDGEFFRSYDMLGY